jgi:DNA-binding MarR family transcriptional regulator
VAPSEEVSLELTRQLRAAGQLLHARLTTAWQAEELNLHPAAAMLLSDLATKGECRPSELARRNMVDISVVSRQIAQLSAAGLVHRRPAPEDGRAALVSVSERGHTELKRWREKHISFVQHALHGWTEAEVAALSKGLTLMNTAFRAAVTSREPLDRR